MELVKIIQQLADNFLSDTVAIRRHLHAHPELSFNEYQTSAFIQNKLSEYGISFQNGIADTGIVAIVEGQNPGSRTVALRADMDALPIEEANNVPYKSNNKGIMHACGHDAHTASLLCTARILTQIKNQFEGTVKFIFQPAEEKNPGGASLMIKAGALENPKPAAIIGQHVYPLMAAGKVGFKSGMMMASADEIYVRIKGKGGHGAVPQLTIDPIAISAQIITALQQIVSRKADPTTPSVLTFGRIASVGGTYNVIPDEVRLEGTFRTMDEKWRFEAHQKMKQMACGIAEAMGAVCEFDIEVGYPYLINDTDLTERCRQSAIEFLGHENVEELPLRMTAEDFAYYTHVTKGCFYRLGTADFERGICSQVHTPTFDIDEKSLAVGAGLMTWLALKELAYKEREQNKS